MYQDCDPAGEEPWKLKNSISGAQLSQVYCFDPISDVLFLISVFLNPPDYTQILQVEGKTTKISNYKKQNHPLTCIIVQRSVSINRKTRRIP